MTFGSEGDLGDLTFLLSVAKELPGGPHTILLQRSRVTKGGGIINQAPFVTDLIKSQPYIAECRPQIVGEYCEWNSGEFRGGRHHGKTETLLNAHLSHLRKTKNLGHGITGNEPWLTVEPSPLSSGLIAINRTDRYRNPFFPWKRIVDHYGPLLVFLGLPHEHGAFQNDFGPVAYHPTKTLLEMAQFIAGSALFIGNQSCANALAEGLKHLMIQETSLEIPDCVFLRTNAQYVDTGKVLLPAIGDRPELLIRSPMTRTADVSTHTTPPPGYWEYGSVRHSIFGELVKLVRINYPEVEDPEGAVRHANVERAPEFFMGDVIRNRFQNTERARVNAGYPPRTAKEMIS